MDTQEKTNYDKQAIIRELMGDDEDKLFETLENFSEMLMRYNSAIREIRTKFEVLNDKRMGYPVTVGSIRDNLNDVAGVRVICSFVDDIYSVAEMLAKQDDIEVVCVKDYIKDPKPNGYRSYHMIVEVPVFFSDRKENMRVEIQIRTVAMDFWASLEHQMRYKNDNAAAKKISDELKTCAETIAATDLKMMELRKRIENQ